MGKLKTLDAIAPCQIWETSFPSAFVKWMNLNSLQIFIEFNLFHMNLI